MVLDDALVHEQEQNFIRGREKSDRGREVGVMGEGSGGGERGREVGERGGKWEMGTPLSTPSYIDCILTVYSRKGAYPFKSTFPEPYPLQKGSLFANNNLNETQ